MTHDPESLTRHVLTSFADVHVVVDEDYGGSFFFVGEERMHPFATLVTKDDPYDAWSRLGAPGRFRFNVGVSDATFQARFGAPPADPATSGIDYAEADRLFPHPVYAKQRWASVVNPGERTWDDVAALLAEAYGIGAAKERKRRAAK